MVMQCAFEHKIWGQIFRWLFHHEPTFGVVFNITLYYTHLIRENEFKEVL